MTKIPVKLRPPSPSDKEFILSSWLKSFRNSDLSNFIPNDLYYTYHGNIVKSCLLRSLATVACNPEDEDQVYGYLVYELLGDIFIIHYVYTKNIFRDCGIAKHMLKSVYPQFGQAESFITHIDQTTPRIVNNFKTKKPEIKRTSWFIKKRDDYKLIYNPFAMIR